MRPYEGMRMAEVFARARTGTKKDKLNALREWSHRLREGRPLHTQRMYAVGSDGLSTYSHSETALAWCISGACRAAGIYFPLDVISGEAIKVDDVTVWNDEPGRTADEVADATDKIVTFLRSGSYKI